MEELIKKVIVNKEVKYEIYSAGKRFIVIDYLNKHLLLKYKCYYSYNN